MSTHQHIGLLGHRARLLRDFEVACDEIARRHLTRPGPIE